MKTRQEAVAGIETVSRVGKGPVLNGFSGCGREGAPPSGYSRALISPGGGTRQTEDGMRQAVAPVSWRHLVL